jgi:hypothetical protein
MDRADQRTSSVFSAEYLEVKLHFVFNMHGTEKSRVLQQPPEKKNDPRAPIKNRDA